MLYNASIRKDSNNTVNNVSFVMLKPYISPIRGDVPSEKEQERRLNREKNLEKIGIFTSVYSSKQLVFCDETPLRLDKQKKATEYISRGEEPPQELIDWLQDYWKKHPEEYVMSFEEYEKRYVKGEK